MKIRNEIEIMMLSKHNIQYEIENLYVKIQFIC